MDGNRRASFQLWASTILCGRLDAGRKKIGTLFFTGHTEKKTSNTYSVGRKKIGSIYSDPILSRTIT
jgi:hypothetical protein